MPGAILACLKRHIAIEALGVVSQNRPLRHKRSMRRNPYIVGNGKARGLLRAEGKMRRWLRISGR